MQRDTRSTRDPRIGRPEPAPVAPRQRRVMQLLEDRARRTDLLAALTSAGGFEPRRAAAVLCAELGELETSAAEADLDGLVAMARATRKIVECLGGGRSDHWRQRGVIVLDDNE